MDWDVWEKMAKEERLLRDVSSVYLHLQEAFRGIAMGGGGETILRAFPMEDCKGTIMEATRYAEANPDAPAPVGKLGKMVGALVDFCELTPDKWREREQKDRYMMDLLAMVEDGWKCGWVGMFDLMRRGIGIDRAAECRGLAVEAATGGNYRFALARMRAECKAEVAAARKKFYQGKKNTTVLRQLKREVKEAVELKRGLDVVALVGNAGMTTQEAAKKLGVSQATVSKTYAAMQRKAGGSLPRLERGRRWDMMKSGRRVEGTSAEIALEQGGTREANRAIDRIERAQGKNH
jgi:predicted transcriptional regulator